jgi:hypothetical protein
LIALSHSAKESFNNISSSGSIIIIIFIIRLLGVFSTRITSSFSIYHNAGSEILVFAFLFLAVSLSVVANSSSEDNRILFTPPAILGMVFSVLEISAIDKSIETLRSRPSLSPRIFSDNNNEEIQTPTKIDVEMSSPQYSLVTPKPSSSSSVSSVSSSSSSSLLLQGGSSAKRETLTGLDTLRFFASIHIVLYHFYSDASNNPVWRYFCSWGGSELTLFFMLSGFILAYQYSGSDRLSKLSTLDFWTKRFFRLYPTYLVSILVMCTLLPIKEITVTVLIALIFCVQTWLPFAFENNINTPSWTVGSFLFLYALFPASCKIISGCFFILKL